MEEAVRSGLPQTSRQLRTCNLCRQRRVKCDRLLPHCSNCLRSEVICVYPPGRGRAPKRPRRNLAPQVSERLSRLENIIEHLGAAARETEAASLTDQDSEQHSFDLEFSRLKVDESKSYYVNNALWVTLSNEVEELRDLLFEPASEEFGSEETPITPSTTSTATAASMSPQEGLNAAVFGPRTASSLSHYHPSLPQAVMLFSAFSENVAPLVRIFHMPTLSKMYWDAIASTGSLGRHTEALLFTIYYSAVISLTPEQCLSILNETREVALGRYRFAVEQAFAQGNLLGTQSMTMLQAVVLFLSALPNEDDSRAGWALTSLVFHIARTMGLHRDGTIFGLKPFETEIRRRLWWQICVIDSRSSEYHCNEPIAQGFVTDTKPPLHINDLDLSPEMVEPPPERWDQATDMTLTLIRCETIQTGRKLGCMKVKQKKEANIPGSPLAADDSSDTADQRQAMVQDLETRLRERYLPICDSSVPFQMLSSAVARTIIGRFQLVTQYSNASREKGLEGGTTNASAARLNGSVRDRLFEISIDILEASVMLLTNKDLTRFSWYSKTHTQWGAMAFALSELCSRPQSAQCDRAWDCVKALYKGWKVEGSRQDETRLALWRPIRRLMAKARYVREMQQTDSRLPSTRSDLGVQRQHDDDAGPNSRNQLSQSPMSSYPGNWYETVKQTRGSIATDEDLLPPLLSAADSSMNQDEALQRVLGTEALGSFMDLALDWPWAGGDNVDILSPAGFDLGRSGLF